jgi:hypothetical protein
MRRSPPTPPPTAPPITAEETDFVFGAEVLVAVGIARVAVLVVAALKTWPNALARSAFLNPSLGDFCVAPPSALQSLE